VPEAVPASSSFRSAEFFAGVGLVGEALRTENIRVAWAHDIDPIKRRLFEANHDPDVFHLGDVRDVKGDDIPDIELATASFPCTDVSLAGNRAGLAGEESGMFWEFTRVLEEMDGRRPRVILLENVVGFFSSNGGEDLRDAFERLNGLGYVCDLLFVDARWFVPQSRPRLFIVGSLDPISDEARCTAGETAMRPSWFADFAARHPELAMQTLALTPPEGEVEKLDAIVERLAYRDSRWWDEARTTAFLDSLSDVNAERLSRLKKARKLTWRTAYRRTRNGAPVWEIREDAISGCLRTARGGSSKQAVVEAGRGKVRVRWMTAREYARLQGVPDFDLSDVSESQAMFGFGDAVCVPAVRFIAQHYLAPLLRGEITAKVVEPAQHEGVPEVSRYAAVPTCA
jgi:DNA (cytosine-5)-methyltransferase 1